MKKHVIDMRKLAVFLLAGVLLAAGTPVYADGQTASDNAAEMEAGDSAAGEEADAETARQDTGNVTDQSETEIIIEESGKSCQENHTVLENDDTASDEETDTDSGTTESETDIDQDGTEVGTADTDTPSGPENGEGSGNGDSGLTDPEIPSDTGNPYIASDPATGIAIEADAGIISVPSFFVVTPIESGEEYEMLSMLLSATQDQFRIYNLGLWDMTGQSVTPAGAVTVKIPVPAGYGSDRLAVYKIGMDGSRTEQTIRLEDGTVVFETEELGLYAITQKKDEAQMQLPDRLEPTEKVDRLELNKVKLSASAGTSGTSVKTDSGAVGYGKTAAVPETGDDTNVTAWIVLLVAAAAAVIAVVVIRKRK